MLLVRYLNVVYMLRFLTTLERSNNTPVHVFLQGGIGVCAFFLIFLPYLLNLKIGWHYIQMKTFYLGEC